MPFYHRKYGVHGRKSAYQVTKEWKADLAAKEQERQERRKARREKRYLRKQNEKIKHREEMRELKVKNEELKRLDKERFEATKRIQEHNYRVAHMRVKRSEAWWRENAEKKKELERQHRLELERQAEFRRRERERELRENWGMKIAEQETRMHMSVNRMTNEQLYMRRVGTIEAIYSKEKKASQVHIQSRAAQNMRELDLHILSRNLRAAEEDSGDDAEERPKLTLEDEDEGVEEDITFIEEGWQYTLSHDLGRYPDANTINCK